MLAYGPQAKTILLIEDDDDVRDEFEHALQRAGYAVVCAANGLEALSWLRSQPTRPHLILLDWMMPVMDGMAFLGHQASDPRYAPIPVVVVSAVARMARIPSLCVAAVMAKPVRLRALVDIVDKLTGTPPRGGSSTPSGDSGEWDRNVGSESPGPMASQARSMRTLRRGRPQPASHGPLAGRLAQPWYRVRRAI